MKLRRAASVALLGALIGLAAACGSPTTFEHPTGSDDRVLVIAPVGGLMTPENDFLTLPGVLVFGDGTAIFARPVGTLEAGVEVFDQRMLSTDEVQDVLRMASSYDLLETRDASGFDDDGGGLFVHIWTDGEQFSNGAFGSYGEPDTNRDRIWKFIDELYEYLRSDDRSAPVDEYRPDEYAVFARKIDEQSSELSLREDFAEWSDKQISLELADAQVCALVDALEVDDTLADGDLPVFLNDRDSTYVVAIRPALPGVDCR